MKNKQWVLSKKYKEALELLSKDSAESSILYIKDQMKVSRAAAGKYLSNLREMGLIELKRGQRFKYCVTEAGRKVIPFLDYIDRNFEESDTREYR